MEPKSEKKESKKNEEKPFFVRPYEEVENGFIDDRGFYTTPNGSFWDEELTYFNHYGFDQYGGSYDKYGVYHPGEGYDEKMGIYNNQKEFFDLSNIIDNNKFGNKFNSNLIENELKDENENIIKKYEKLEESEEEDDYDDDTFNFDELKEVYEDIIKKEFSSKNDSKNKIIEKKESEKIEKEQIYNVKYLEVNVSEECDDGVVAFDENLKKIEDENIFPLKSTDFNFKVDVDNGKILNWPDKRIWVKVYIKAKDSGLYKYYDNLNNQIYKEYGHVPYFLGINTPAYDEDINFDTDVNGYILKWNERKIKDKIIKYLLNIELNDIEEE